MDYCSPAGMTQPVDNSAGLHPSLASLTETDAKSPQGDKPTVSFIIEAENPLQPADHRANEQPRHGRKRPRAEVSGAEEPEKDNAIQNLNDLTFSQAGANGAPAPVEPSPPEAPPPRQEADAPAAPAAAAILPPPPALPVQIQLPLPFAGAPQSLVLPPTFMPAVCQLLLVYVQRAQLHAAQQASELKQVQSAHHQQPSSPPQPTPAASLAPAPTDDAAAGTVTEVEAQEPPGAHESRQPAEQQQQQLAHHDGGAKPAAPPVPPVSSVPPAVVAVRQLRAFDMPLQLLLQASAHLMVVGALSPVDYHSILGELGSPFLRLQLPSGPAAGPLLSTAGLLIPEATAAAAAAPGCVARAPAPTAPAGAATAPRAATPAASVPPALSAPVSGPPGPPASNLPPAAHPSLPAAVVATISSALASRGSTGAAGLGVGLPSAALGGTAEAAPAPSAAGPAGPRGGSGPTLEPGPPAAAGATGPGPDGCPSVATAASCAWVGRGCGPSVLRLGLGRRLFRAIAEQLPTNTELDCIIPPVNGFSGVLYKVQGSTEVGCALWDGAQLRDLGLYTTVQDARQSLSIAIKLISAGTAVPAAPRPPRPDPATTTDRVPRGTHPQLQTRTPPDAARDPVAAEDAAAPAHLAEDADADATAAPVVAGAAVVEAAAAVASGAATPGCAPEETTPGFVAGADGAATTAGTAEGGPSRVAASAPSVPETDLMDAAEQLLMLCQEHRSFGPAEAQARPEGRGQGYGLDASSSDPGASLGRTLRPSVPPGPSQDAGMHHEALEKQGPRQSGPEKELLQQQRQQQQRQQQRQQQATEPAATEPAATQQRLAAFWQQQQSAASGRDVAVPAAAAARRGHEHGGMTAVASAVDVLEHGRTAAASEAGALGDRASGMATPTVTARSNAGAAAAGGTHGSGTGSAAIAAPFGTATDAARSASAAAATGSESTLGARQPGRRVRQRLEDQRPAGTAPLLDKGSPGLCEEWLPAVLQRGGAAAGVTTDHHDPDQNGEPPEEPAGGAAEAERGTRAVAAPDSSARWPGESQAAGVDHPSGGGGGAGGFSDAAANTSSIGALAGEAQPALEGRLLGTSEPLSATDRETPDTTLLLDLIQRGVLDRGALLGLLSSPRAAATLRGAVQHQERRNQARPEPRIDLTQSAAAGPVVSEPQLVAAAEGGAMGAEAWGAGVLSPSRAAAALRPPLDGEGSEQSGLPLDWRQHLREALMMQGLGLGSVMTEDGLPAAGLALSERVLRLGEEQRRLHNHQLHPHQQLLQEHQLLQQELQAQHAEMGLNAEGPLGRVLVLGRSRPPGLTHEAGHSELGLLSHSRIAGNDGGGISLHAVTAGAGVWRRARGGGGGGGLEDGFGAGATLAAAGLAAEELLARERAVLVALLAGGGGGSAQGLARALAAQQGGLRLTAAAAAAGAASASAGQGPIGPPQAREYLQLGAGGGGGSGGAGGVSVNAPSPKAHPAVHLTVRGPTLVLSGPAGAGSAATSGTSLFGGGAAAVAAAVMPTRNAYPSRQAHAITPMDLSDDEDSGNGPLLPLERCPAARRHLQPERSVLKSAAVAVMAPGSAASAGSGGGRASVRELGLGFRDYINLYDSSAAAAAGMDPGTSGHGSASAVGAAALLSSGLANSLPSYPASCVRSSGPSGRGGYRTGHAAAEHSITSEGGLGGATEDYTRPHSRRPISGRLAAAVEGAGGEAGASGSSNISGVVRAGAEVASAGAQAELRRTIQQAGVSREYAAVTNLVGLGLQEALALVRQRQSTPL